jgi:fatty-acyl-CoA synthase
MVRGGRPAVHRIAVTEWRRVSCDTTFVIMRSTMMDAPLLISRILEHGATVHGRSEVVTWTGAEPRRTTYAEIGATAARLAHALRDDLGVTGDQRVATFMWNNAYFAVPSMGAVMHTLNIRLFPDQVSYIANHAEDKVVLVDSTLVPLLAKVLPQMSTVEHVVLVGGGDPEPLVTAGEGRLAVHRWDDLLAGKPDRFDWPEVDERDAAALCYTSGTTGNP